MRPNNTPHQGLLKDEDGVVMVEFIIIFPFLAMLMAAIMYFTEATRFQMSALHLAQTQTWRTAARDQAGLSPSDDFGFAGSTSSAAQSTMHPRNPVMITKFNDAGHDYISLLTSGGGFDTLRTAFLVPPNNAVWEYLSINPNTFNRNALDPLDPTLMDPTAGLRYRNASFTRPLAAFSSTFVGTSDSVDNEGLAMSDLEFTVAPALPLIHDPFSIFWGASEPHGGKIQRLRNVDRYTITSDPFYLAGLALHGVMTLNMRSMSHLSSDLLLRDLYGGVDQNVNNPSSELSSLMDLFSVVGSIFPGGGTKHAQPLWKVDKNADTQDHDVNGTVTYGGTDWGKPITERHRLNETQSNADRWSMIQ